MINTKSNAINIVEKEIQERKINVITGGNNYLYYRLKECFKISKSVDIIVSFLMESGVKLLLEDLKEALDRGVKIRLLTGNYLKITQPQALFMIKKELGDRIDLRFYNVPNKSFHPKAYIFHYKNEGNIFVGSSNISRGALTNSIEWNYRINKSEHEEDFNEFLNTFEDLFFNHSIEIDDDVLYRYSKEWIKPKVYNDLEKIQQENDCKDLKMFAPKGAQIEALYSLEKSREEGFEKGLVVAATGIGKTYLSAFDSLKFEKVLFIAHREEIIKQAKQSFRNVRNDNSLGLFYGERKEKDKNCIFALVQTLAKDEYLNESFFEKDYFDYIVIDEFHHATANNYQKILHYFEPKFLLGLTATPERLDNRDIFALCDYNLVYEVRLRDAINKGWLVPFRYYGIYDETVDYSDINIKNGKYNEEEIEKALSIQNRADLILNHYNNFTSKRAIGFCTSKKHAEYMAKHFNENGIKAIAVYSGEKGEYCENREEGISLLIKGEINVLFSVDMFNEGLDIPSIDMVLFLRPTESPTVFLQQLGRGLRKAKGKEYLNALDFIGNYKKANLIPFLLSGKNYSDVKNSSKTLKLTEYDYPEECFVNFDFKIINIFKKQTESELTLKEKVNEEFFRVKEYLGHVPSRKEFFLEMDSTIYDAIKSKSKFNIFNKYLDFLNELNMLTEEEKELYNSIGREFINMIENTSMSKTYKMPLLLAFYNKDEIKLKINKDDIYNSFLIFYKNGSNGIDLINQKSTKDYKNWGAKDYYKLAINNPINAFMKTHNDFFFIKEDDFCLNEKLEKFKNNESFKKHFKDAIDYRVIQYYRNRFKTKELENY